MGKQTFRHIALAIGGLFFLGQFLLRAGEEIKFERLSFEQGLFQSHITTLFQDSRGFLWIGTSDGLNRYDGYQFSAYRFDPLDSTSISGNYIYQIFEDREGYLWITASGGGINRYNPASQQFTHFRHDPDNPASLSNDNVSAWLEDRQGHLWIGTNGGGLNLFDYRRGKFSHLKHRPENPHSLSGNIVSALLEDRQGNLWVGTNGAGLNKLTLPPATPQTERPYPVPEKLKFTRFYGRGPTYAPSISLALDSLLMQTDRRLASIIHLGNYQESVEVVEMLQPTDVLVVAMGDGNAYGMSDYGWIESGEPARVIWQMDYDKSTHLGGASRNRLQIAVLRLTPGKYTLRYRCESQHSAFQWSGSSPEHSDLWGIQLLAISRTTARTFQEQLSRRTIPSWLPHSWITALHEDEAGNLWIGTADGLARLNRHDLREKTFTVFKHDPGNPNTLNHSYISAIYPGENALWIRTPAAGLNHLDKRRETVTRFSGPAASRSLEKFQLSGETVTALLKDRRGMLWIGTANAGLNCLKFPASSPAEQENRLSSPLVDDYQHDPGQLQSVSDNAISAIFEDRSGILWVGTQRGGLNKINRTRQKFHHFTHNTEDAQTLSHPVITAIMEDRDRQIWIGTYGGGLNRLERDSQHPHQFYYTHFRHNPEDPHSLPHDRVSALYEDQSGNIWVGTHGGGMSQLVGKGSGDYHFKHYRYEPHVANSISGNFVNTISEDQYGQLWIGTNSGLNKFDRLTGHFTQYRHEANNPYSLSNNEVWAIYEDSYSNGKTLWIGTRAGGLNKFDRQNNRFIRYTRDFDDPHSLNNPAILSIYQDRAGTLWFGTYSGGLNKFNRETEQFTFFTERDGLANNMIFGILEDQRGHLWLSTNKGISKFDIEKNTFKNYDVYDGLQANEFNAGAYCLTHSGEMLFGGGNGFNLFHPDSVQASSFIPPITLTAFSIYGENHNRELSRALFHQQPLRLSYDQNFIAFEFAALDFTNPLKNRYAYQLEGFNDNWLECGTRRFISFTNLDPGEYVFRVKGSNPDGVWNEAGIAVRLIIAPPFWKTWWFLLICGALLTAGVYLLHHYRVRIKLRRLLEIEQVRLQENERVRTKAAHDFHDELGHRLTKISLFSEIVKRSLNGTPPEITDYLNRIRDNAKSLSSGMRDFIWTLDPARDSLYEVAVRLKDFGDELFDKTGIDFRIEGLTENLQSIPLSTDWRRHLTLIFKEAMTNALKHAACENVILQLRLNRNRLSIILTDDGIGLLPEAVLAEGDAPANTAAKPTSSGNGLQNMQLRAQKLGGAMDFLPHRPRGTRIGFSAEMPRIGN